MQMNVRRDHRRRRLGGKLSRRAEPKNLGSSVAILVGRVLAEVEAMRSEFRETRNPTPPPAVSVETCWHCQAVYLAGREHICESLQLTAEHDMPKFNAHSWRAWARSQ